jgi:hypothetical protein
LEEEEEEEEKEEDREEKERKEGTDNVKGRRRFWREIRLRRGGLNI